MTEDPSTPLRTLDDAMAWLSDQTNYEQTTDWSYQRLGYHLDAYEQFLARIGHPERNLPPTIHVAGTKGKGSTCLMIEALYRSVGMRTGLFLSPHLESPCERIRINGEPVAEAEFAALLETLRDDLDAFRQDVRPITFFEILTTMAITAFAKHEVDVAVLEVGLGGRLDATNVVNADVAVITHIGLDHTDKLGGTLPEIAREKAGIIKAGRTVVVGPMPDEPTHAAVMAIAQGLDPEPVILDGGRLDDERAPRDFGIVRDGRALRLQLPVLMGVHAAIEAPDWPPAFERNAACALAACHMLGMQHGHLLVDPDTGLRAVTGTPLPGRLERFRIGNVTVILDCAHNVDSFRTLTRHCVAHDCRPVLLLGMNRDKLTDGLLAELPPARAVVCTTVPGLRAATAVELHAHWPTDPPVDVSGVDDPVAALDAALGLAATITDAPPVVVITGSVYLAGALRGILQARSAASE